MKKTFNIKGMHCNSCAILIERDLKDKVNSVSANYSRGEVEIDFDKNEISENEIKDKINALGYEIIDEKKEGVKKESLKNKMGLYVLIGSLILLLFVVYSFFFKNIPFSEISIPELGDKTSLLLLFAAGILTGFHCISMCGGFVVSYTAKNALNGHKSFKQHLVYGGSKVISYTIIGGIFGLIGGVFAFSIGLRSWVAVLAGFFMIFYALSMFGIKFFRKFQFNPKFLTKIASSESNKYKGPYSRPLVTGLLNGLFIACGPLQAMYLYAMGTGSLFSGATSLATFGLGTLPVMLGFGSLATVISHSATKKILKISAVIVLILGLIMLNRGLTLMGSSYSFDAIKTKISGGILSQSLVNTGTEVVINNGVQEVNMDVDASGYSPNSFVLKKGVPVKWNVNVKQLTGCNSEIVMNDYNINARLKQGLNTFEFTPDKIGTIRFSCGMGMIRGSFIVTETGTASQQEIASATPQSGGSCSMGSGGGCGCGG
jgi:sulfite exporter TauE/SafE/copper chaperone CopZ